MWGLVHNIIMMSVLVLHCIALCCIAVHSMIVSTRMSHHNTAMQWNADLDTDRLEFYPMSYCWQINTCFFMQNCDDDKLVEAVRGYFCLWKVSSKAYRDATAKEQTCICTNIGHHFACCHDSVHATPEFCEQDLCNCRKHFIMYYMFMHRTAMQCKCCHHIVNQP
jgi:hypothetical protein